MATHGFEEQLAKQVNIALKAKIEEIAAEHKKKVIAQLEEKITEVVAGVAMRTEQYINIERGNREMIIRIKLSKD